jgi:hypothetical protein
MSLERDLLKQNWNWDDTKNLAGPQGGLPLFLALKGSSAEVSDVTQKARCEAAGESRLLAKGLSSFASKTKSDERQVVDDFRRLSGSPTSRTLMNRLSLRAAFCP